MQPDFSPVRVRLFGPWSAIGSITLGLATMAIAPLLQSQDSVIVVSSLVGLVIGAVIATATGAGPGARSTRAVERSLPGPTVRVQDPRRQLAVEAAAWVALVFLLQATIGSIFVMGMAGIVFGGAQLYDLSVVRRWEHKNDARLAWVVRERRWRLRSPYRLPETVAIHATPPPSA